MKVISILTVLSSIILNNLFGQTFKEIYDFNVKDIFQYHTNWNGEYSSDLNETLEKYEIISKETIGDTIKYNIISKELFHGYTSMCDPWGPEYCEHRYYLSEINSTLTYIDSSNHFLNKPIGSLVPLIFGDTVLTRILIESTDDLNVKTIGGDMNINSSNLFRFTNDTNNLDTFRLPIDNQIFFPQMYKLSYAKNLGLIKEEYETRYGESWKERILEGYVINGDTTGIITSDELFTGIHDLSASSYKIFPNPVADYLNICSYENTIKKFIISDINGKIIIEGKINSNINVENLCSGFYLIKLININNSVKTLRFLKL